MIFEIKSKFFEIKVKQYQYVNKFIEKLFRDNVDLKSVVDMGCSKCHMLKHLAKYNFSTIKCVDIDFNNIKSSHRKVNRLMRKQNKKIEIFACDVTNKDDRLKDVDIVICIDLIELFSLKKLDEFVENVFDFIKPKFVIIIAANFDFNRYLIKRDPDKSDYYFGLREKKHMFEFNQEEFRTWSNEIVKTYPNYQYTIDEFGPTSTEVDHKTYGYYNQVVIFEKLKNPDQNMDVEISSENAET